LSLSQIEKETVIQFDESTNVATVYTASLIFMKSLKRAGYIPSKKNDGGWWFKVPINELNIGKNNNEKSKIS